MQSQILVLSGKKQSGKTSTSNFLHGKILTNACVIDGFDIDDEGRLFVKGVYDGGDGLKRGMLHLDPERKDVEYLRYASQNVWPHIKSYSYADTLKEFCMRVFGVPYEALYGEEKYKKRTSHIRWKQGFRVALKETKLNVLKEGRQNYYMTNREVMQVFGTDMCRRLDNDCWSRDCFNRIHQDCPNFAVITDCRFVNEVGWARKNGAKVIRFTRSVDEKDTHRSETELDSRLDLFDGIVENNDMSVHEKNQAVWKMLLEWGYVRGEVT